MSNFLCSSASASTSLAVVIVLSLSWVRDAHAQCAPLQADPSKLPAHKAPHEPLLPESGYLSDTSYTNDFFGFTLDLPIAAQGHLVKLPLMPERQHALLAIAYQNGDHSGSLTIDAIEPREGWKDSRPSNSSSNSALGHQAPTAGAQTESQNQLQVSPQGTLMAPQPQIPNAAVSVAGRTLSLVGAAQGREIHRAVLDANQELPSRRSRRHQRQRFSAEGQAGDGGVRFYCTADDGTLATKEGKLVTPEGERYEGPTVPTWRADAAIQSLPASPFLPAKSAKACIATPRWACSMSCQRAGTFCPRTTAAIRLPELDSLREFEFLHACSRTLLRIQQPGSGDAAGNGRPPLIVLRALDPTCLSLRTPAAPSDTKIAEEVGVSLEAMTEFGQVASHESGLHLGPTLHGLPRDHRRARRGRATCPAHVANHARHQPQQDGAGLVVHGADLRRTGHHARRAASASMARNRSSWDQHWSRSDSKQSAGIY